MKKEINIHKKIELTGSYDEIKRKERYLSIILNCIEEAGKKDELFLKGYASYLRNML